MNRFKVDLLHKNYREMRVWIVETKRKKLQYYFVSPFWKLVWFFLWIVIHFKRLNIQQMEKGGKNKWKRTHEIFQVTIWHPLVKTENGGKSLIFRWCSSFILTQHTTFAETQLNHALSFDMSKCIVVFTRNRTRQQMTVSTQSKLYLWTNSFWSIDTQPQTNNSVQQCGMWMLWSSNIKWRVENIRCLTFIQSGHLSIQFQLAAVQTVFAEKFVCGWK